MIIIVVMSYGKKSNNTHPQFENERKIMFFKNGRYLINVLMKKHYCNNQRRLFGMVGTKKDRFDKTFLSSVRSPLRSVFSNY